ncbi:MAG TPA: UxaA family hydrolase [Desulfobacterales bacterium]|jgi:(2R)-sulfolactate sulfo-lyase subunit beta|nr:UxaA family hydrolase [Desulfobacterales bacterium]
MAKPKNPKVFAYRRENGRVGIRNHVVILPLDDLSNSACEKVAHNVKGTKAIPHAYGRLQFGKDLELFFRTMIGTGANPNVAAVVVIGIEPDWTSRIVEGIAKTGKPVAGFSIERFGEFKTVEMASWKAKEYVQWASELRREPVDLKEIWVSVKCGESDTTSGLASNPTVGNAIEKLVSMGATTSFGETSEITGAEMVCKERAVNRKVGEQFMATFNAYQKMIDDNKTDDLSGSQPTKGNIRGGLTTIEEKAFGNLQKIGKKAKYVGVLDKAEAPTGPGLWFMDTSSAAAEAVTLWAAAGFVAHFFPTGQGNIIGNPIEPVIKLTANPLTAKTMSEHVDYDCSAILRGEMTLDQSGDNLLQMLIRTCNGRLTAQEVLGHEEFVLTKLYESA